MAAIGGFRSNLSITSTTGNPLLFCFPKSRVSTKTVVHVTLPGCRVSRDRQACFVNWFCSSYLYISTKKTDFNRFYIFLNDLRIFNRSKFFFVTRFSVTSLLVTRYFVTLFSNTPFFPTVPGTSWEIY